MISVERLVRSYHDVPQTHRETGRQWYPDAWRECQRIAKHADVGIGPQRVAGVIAALSPRTRWSENVKIAEVACLAAKRHKTAYAVRDACKAAFPLRRDKVVEILLHGKHPKDMSLGPKCDAFWRAIAGDTNQVVIDSWMLKIMRMRQPTPLRLFKAKTTIMAAARKVGESPRDLQSILWVNARGGPR